jgi:hypothetical protein
MKNIIGQFAPYFCGLILFILTSAPQLRAANYYINSRVGNDGNNGTSQETPWKSLKNLSGKFAPGDNILFAKGSSYTGGFVFTSSGTAEKPITFSTYSTSADVILKTDRKQLTPIFEKYGAGAAPSFTNPDWSVLNGNIFRIEASYVVIDGLYFHDNTNPPESSAKIKNVQKMGAIYLALKTHHNTVRNCEFFNTPVGIKVKGTDNLITRNYLHDRTEMMAASWGPIAIMIVGARNEISYNRVENYGAYGGPYGSDGGVVELDGVDDDFSANDIIIHHNTSINNHGFLEMAARNVQNITVAYNLSDDKNQFIGGGSMKNVRVENNTIIRTREPNVDRFVFWTFYPAHNSFTIRNNIFVIPPDMKVFGTAGQPNENGRVSVRSPIGEHPHDHNIYYSPVNPGPLGVAPVKNDRLADPLFIDYENRNFRLRSNSPAKNKGAGSEFTTDLDGRFVNNKKPPIGAYEF